MDLDLLTPFGQQEIPDSVTTTLIDEASCARYNSTGRLIAAGRKDGWGTIWDLDTQGVLRSLEGHAKTVTSVSWSRNSRYVLTSSRDWNCILWDLEEADRVETVRFDTPVLWAQLNPRNSKIFLAVLETGQCLVVDIRHGEVMREELIGTTPVDDEPAGNVEQDSRDPSQTKAGKKTSFRIASFTPSGLEIFTGSSTGEILIFNVRSKALIHQEKSGSTSLIRHITFEPSGRYVAVASKDRIVRIFSIKQTPNGMELELMHKLQDNVAKQPWNGITWSKDGTFVVGGSGHKASHTIYIWDRDTGRLEKILEGPRQPLQDLHWHPNRPAMLSVNYHGLIHLWSIVTQEKWGAFAAGFEELEENIIYEEKEDEFDIEDEEAAKRRKDEEEDQDVDIVNFSDETAEVPNTTSLPSSQNVGFVQDPQKAEDLIWIEDDPDDDLEPYFPPVYPEPPDRDGHPD